MGGAWRGGARSRARPAGCSRQGRSPNCACRRRGQRMASSAPEDPLLRDPPGAPPPIPCQCAGGSTHPALDGGVEGGLQGPRLDGRQARQVEVEAGSGGTACGVASSTVPARFHPLMIKSAARPRRTWGGLPGGRAAQGSTAPHHLAHERHPTRPALRRHFTSAGWRPVATHLAGAPTRSPDPGPEEARRPLAKPSMAAA